jgi:hypothetical protein
MEDSQMKFEYIELNRFTGREYDREQDPPSAKLTELHVFGCPDVHAMRSPRQQKSRLKRPDYYLEEAVSPEAYVQNVVAENPIFEAKWRARFGSEPPKYTENDFRIMPCSATVPLVRLLAFVEAGDSTWLCTYAVVATLFELSSVGSVWPVRTPSTAKPGSGTLPLSN